VKAARRVREGAPGKRTAVTPETAPGSLPHASGELPATKTGRFYHIPTQALTAYTNHPYTLSNQP
jgi:hypothetical protein